MKILIIGAGQVGGTLAANLANEAFDITLVDNDEVVLQELRDKLDIQTVKGWGSHPDVLRRAGADDADMLVAVTSSDEVNMIACQVAHCLFHTPIRLARVRSLDYLAYPRLFRPEAVPIDFIISPEQLVTDFIEHLIESPGVLQVLDFANGRAQLVAVEAQHGGALVGKALHTLHKWKPAAETRVVAIFRRDRAILPEGETVIEAGDEVFFLAAHQHIRTLVTAFRQSDRRNRRVTIAGGGNIGKRLAETIESKYLVKLIELDRQRCYALAESLRRAIVLHGDAADENLLKQEGIENTDIFCAVTNDDEANIMSAMLARHLGVRKVVAIINRSSYAELAEGSAVDIAISPAQITISALLTHIRRGDVVAVHSLRRGAAEAIELIAHGDRTTSHVVGRTIQELPLPPGTTVGAIIRGDKLLFPSGGTAFETDDHVILFLADKRNISAVERLFQVSITFL
jgi:trk system potassium uptake protein TrkA